MRLTVSRTCPHTRTIDHANNGRNGQSCPARPCLPRDRIKVKRRMHRQLQECNTRGAACQCYTRSGTAHLSLAGLLTETIACSLPVHTPVLLLSAKHLHALITPLIPTPISPVHLMLVGSKHERVKGFKRNRWRREEAQFLGHCRG